MGLRINENERFQFYAMHWPHNSPADFCEMYKEHFGFAIKTSSAQVRASSYGITSDVSPGYYTVRELADLAQVNRSVVRRMIYSNKLPSKRFGRLIGVPHTAAEKMIEHLKLPSWDSVRVTDAARKLGYCNYEAGGGSSGISKAVFRGLIPSKVVLNTAYIPKAYVEAAEAYLAKTGNIRVPWSKLQVKGFENWRQSA